MNKETTSIRQKIVDRIWPNMGDRDRFYLFRFIMREYIYWAYRAVSNGYVIKIYTRGWIGLYREKIRPMNKRDHRMYMRSPKVADQIFCVKFTRGCFTDDFHFIPPAKLVKRINTQLESDVVYEFIKS